MSTQYNTPSLTSHVGPSPRIAFAGWMQRICVMLSDLTLRYESLEDPREDLTEIEYVHGQDDKQFSCSDRLQFLLSFVVMHHGSRQTFRYQSRLVPRLGA